jgi:hypothetical protein
MEIERLKRTESYSIILVENYDGRLDKINSAALEEFCNRKEEIKLNHAYHIYFCNKTLFTTKEKLKAFKLRGDHDLNELLAFYQYREVKPVYLTGFVKDSAGHNIPQKIKNSCDR